MIIFKYKYLLIVLFIWLYPSANMIAQVMPIDTNGNGFRNISTIDQLRWVSENDSSWSWKFELDCDIDASDTKNWNSCSDGWKWFSKESPVGWLPIGSPWKPFTGKFNGNGFTIFDLCINPGKKSLSSNIGFFGVIAGDGVEIANLHLKSVSIAGRNNIGGIAGKIENCTIRNCVVSGKILGDSYIGGLVGLMLNSTILNSATNVCIDYSYCAGGLVGFSRNSKIESSSTTGAIAYSDEVETDRWLSFGNGAGFISEANKCTILNCFSSCNISRKSYQYEVGFVYSSNGIIENCYYNGKIYTHRKDLRSPFCHFSEGIIQNSFWNFEKNSFGKKYKYGLGIIASQMQSKQTYLDTGWDFENIWDIDPNKNDGYPFLRNVHLFED
jgi:hypothetical protein